MDDPLFFEEDLDEEKAKRSILVKGVPENVSPIDVVIHFQKRSNGGDEVVNIDDHGYEHRSSVVIRFEDPSISKYAKRIQDIESEFSVKIYGSESHSIVTIRPLPGCTKRKHDDACEEYIKLYREVYDGPMMSKDILLRPGNGSFYSAEDAVKNVLQMKPIVIQKMDEQDKWMFYGEEADVRSAISEVCKALRIDNPFRKTRKMKAQHVPGEEENYAASVSVKRNQRKADDLKKISESERQAHQETNKRKDELQRTLETVRQALQATNQRKDDLQRTLESERQAHQETNQRKDELQRTLESERQAHQATNQRKDELQRTLESERQGHQATNQRKDELQRTLESERQAHQATNQRKDELQRTLESERQAHQATNQRKDELQRTLESERQAHQATNQRKDELQRTLESERQGHQATNQRKDELQRTLESERQAHQATNQRKDELQRTLESERQAHQETNQRKDELQRTLESERQGHQETNQRKDELQRTLESERQAHQETNQIKDELQRTLESERQGHQETNQRKDELQRTLESERQGHQETNQIKERLEISLEQERERNDELLTTQATLQRGIEDYRSSTESCDWVLTRDEIVMTETLIGNGAWGSVTKGKFRGCDVAVKQIHQLILSDHNRRLFEREIGIASRCRHPCLLQFIGATKDNLSPLFVTELLDSSLRAILHERALRPAEIITIALDVTKGLNYLHLCRPTPIIHRDISSANVLLWKHTACWRAKVSDFGTANFLHQSMTACPGAIVYSAPESQTSRQTPKVDVYSFGVMLCEMFVREHPDVAHREEHVARVTNEFFRRLIRRCLQHDPDKRPSMAEILEVLGSFQNQLG